MRGSQSYYNDDDQKSIALPIDVIEQIDEQLGHRYKNRTDFIRAATNAYIAQRNKMGIHKVPSASGLFRPSKNGVYSARI